MILVINPGSSSLKFKLFNSDFDVVESNSSLTVGQKIKTFSKAIDQVFQEVEKYQTEITKVGYRVVHGGNEIREPQAITLPVIKIIEKYAMLAPHHNPSAIEVIHRCISKFAYAQHYAVFDTAYFVDLPDKAKIYPISLNVSEEFDIKRFGMHGISHQFVSESVDPDKIKKVISVHLGAGCSIAAIDGGVPIDTSMGFTPFEGLTMQTRPGDLDPGLVLFLTEKIGLKETKLLVENDSGLAGLTESSGDMLSILSAAGEKMETNGTEIENINPELAHQAIDIFCYRAKKYIGAYAAALGGIDTVAFTGKIGAGSSVIRNKITDGLEYLNFDIKIIEPDEELAIARTIT